MRANQTSLYFMLALIGVTFAITSPLTSQTTEKNESFADEVQSEGEVQTPQAMPSDAPVTNENTTPDVEPAPPPEKDKPEEFDWMQREKWPHRISLLDPVLNRELSLSYAHRKHNAHKYSMRADIYNVTFDWRFNKFFSLETNIPYVEWEATGEPKFRHLDNASLGFKFAFEKRNWYFPLGVRTYFATGDERQKIGHRTLGNIEPYFGMIYRYKNFHIGTQVRWNTQTNIRFREDEFKFLRTLYGDVWAGYRLGHFDLLLEFSKKWIHSPKKYERNTNFVAPGIAWYPLRHLRISLSYPYNISKERDYDTDLLVKVAAVF